MDAPFTSRRISTEPLPRLQLRAATPPSLSPPQCFPCSCRIATPYCGKTTCVTSFFSSGDFIPRGNFTAWLSLLKLISTNTLASFPARRLTSIPSGPEQIHSTARQSARDCLEVQTHSPPLILRWKLPSSLRRNSHFVIPNGVCGVRNLSFLGFSTKRAPRVARNVLSDHSFRSLLWRDGQFLSAIFHGFVRRVRQAATHAVTLADQHDSERAAFQRPGKCSRAIPDRQCMRRIIPGKRNRCVRAFFVVVTVVLVFVQREFSVGPAINANLNRIGCFLGRIFNVRPKGQN
jgi:hypothetical protein